MTASTTGTVARRLATRPLAAAAALALAACADPYGPADDRPDHPTTHWTPRAPGDASPHREGFVERGGVRLHYLDWGGTGPALVLIAGRGENAHVFDDLASQLRARYRVVALTRRGYGQSGRPADGYDVNSLVDDDVAVLDRLKLGRVYLAGHSMGSHELSRLAVRYPERVARLVYLDGSLNDRTDSPACTAGAPTARHGSSLRSVGGIAVGEGIPVDALDPSPPGADDVASFPSFSAYFRTNLPAPWSTALESNLWHAVTLAPDGRVVAMSTADAIDARVGAGLCAYRQEFGAVRAPMLAIVAMPGAIADLYPWLPATLDDRVRALVEERLADVRAGVTANVAGFVARAPGARTLVLEQSNHYVFVRHQQQVAAALRDFLPAELPATR